MALDPR
ncbi:BgTH12-00526 [Blumeria graminis f. sp. triticale]|nr:BgTH12-00526 [Blumeria graminis f. sp. triticale]